MWGWIKRLKAVVDWALTLWGILGLFGATSIASGIIISAGGAIWAVLIGVPVPIAIMAGFCALVGAVYLAMAPMAWRALTRAASGKSSAAPSRNAVPDYKVWTHIKDLTVTEAACLWCECDPNGGIVGEPAVRVQTWKDALKAAIRQHEIAPSSSSEETRAEFLLNVNYPQDSTRVGRDQLIAFAKKHGYRPRFLEDASASAAP